MSHCREIANPQDWVLDNAEEGDLLEFNRKPGFRHFGVLDANAEVVHFASDHHEGAKAKGRVQKTNFYKVAGGDRVDINPTEPSRRKATLRNANADIGATGYNVLTNNCEHVANKWRDGEAWSKQASVVGVLHIAGQGAVNYAPDVVEPVAKGVAAGVAISAASYAVVAAVDYAGRPAEPTWKESRRAETARMQRQKVKEYIMQQR